MGDPDTGFGKGDETGGHIEKPCGDGYKSLGGSNGSGVVLEEDGLSQLEHIGIGQARGHRCY